MLFTERAIIAKPMNTVIEFKKHKVLKRRENMLMEVQDYIDSFVNSNKHSCVGNTTMTEIIGP